MAMTVLARGNVYAAAKHEERIPEGLALDKVGRPTTDPQAFSCRWRPSEPDGQLDRAYKEGAEGIEEILVPGERESRVRLGRIARGIPLKPETLRALIDEGARVNVAGLEGIRG